MEPTGAEALPDLYHRYSGRLMAMAVNILGNRHDAEEVLQEAFLYAWTRAESYDPDRAPVSTWLNLITRSRCLDRLRKRRNAQRAETVLEEQLVLLPAATTSDARAANRERAERVRRAIRTLPAGQRQVLELCYWRGLSQREASEDIGIPLGTVKTRTWLAMKKLRAQLAHDYRELL